MDEFSYLSVLLSIILGLALTEILTGFRRLLQARQRVVLYWPALLWAFLLLIICTQTWWAMFGLRRHHDWTFAGFAVVLLHMVLLYMMAGLILPEITGSEPIDLRANYYAEHRWFCGLAFLTVAVSLSKDMILDGTWPERRNLVFHAVFGLSAFVGVITRREIVHKLFAVLMSVMFALYIALLFSELR